MRKILSLSLLYLFLLSACSEDAELSRETKDGSLLHSDNFTLSKPGFVASRRDCATLRVVETQMKQNPGYAKRQEAVEKHTRALMAAKKDNPNKGGGTNNGGGKGKNKDTTGDGGTSPSPTPYEGVIQIPVVVHVLYNNETENITDAQIQSQINVLNADFNALNSDLSVPAEFEPLVSDVDIEFTLAQVIRKYTSKASWSYNSDMMFDSKGGSNIVDPSKHLNIWVCNLSSVLGFAYYPGGSTSTDGVVVGYKYFGTTGTATAPYHLGRTATHEVGHWLNLRHIWGNGDCSLDDLVADTPVADGPNYGCPGYPTVSCANNDMSMNYMDYVNDPCMVMFSQGQKDRMRALFASGGIRESFLLNN